MMGGSGCVSRFAFFGCLSLLAAAMHLNEPRKAILKFEFE